jgi:hypothetical protein
MALPWERRSCSSQLFDRPLSRNQGRCGPLSARDRSLSVLARGYRGQWRGSPIARLQILRARASVATERAPFGVASTFALRAGACTRMCAHRRAAGHTYGGSVDTERARYGDNDPHASLPTAPIGVDQALPPGAMTVPLTAYRSPLTAHLERKPLPHREVEPVRTARKVERQNRPAQHPQRKPATVAHLEIR